MNYYVYAYLRSKDSPTAKAGTPYYIGKGSGKRAFIDHRYAKHNKGVHTPRDTSQIVFIESNLTELGAFAIERRMIKWYGRKDTGTGILNNRTDGGEGSSGHKHTAETCEIISLAVTTRSAETRQKISAGNKGKHRSEETKQKMREANLGKTMSVESRRKMSMAKQNMSDETKQKMRNKVVSQETREKMSLASKGKSKSPTRKIAPSTRGIQRDVVVCPHCQQSGGTGSMHRWHFDKCRRKI
jgi:NUMOD3 motif